MMSNLLEQPTSFSLRLPDSVHEAAALESQDYPIADKAEQVYLSCLAEYASRSYLRLCGYSMRQKKADTLGFVGRALSDSATVDVLGYGQFACIVVPFGASAVKIPAIALALPIGYFAVEFDDDLQTASVLGFVPQTSATEVERSEVRSLTDLPNYLTQINPVTAAAVRLGQWWNRSFESGWTLISELANADGEPTLAFRSRGTASTPEMAGRRLSASESEETLEDALEDGVVCQKILSLQSAEAQTFALSLMMERFARSRSSILIVARIAPTVGQATLPAEVQLTAADESETIFSSVLSREGSPFIELRFRADPGDYFSLKVAFDRVAVTEAFVV